MNFIKFKELNDWENEDWNFYLQVDGNEEEIEKLKEIIDDCEFYRIDDILIPENEVDILVKHSECGYMTYENKVVGKLDTSGIKKLSTLDVDDIDGDVLYKGGIKNFFK